MSLSRRTGYVIGCIGLLLMLLLVAACGGTATTQTQKPTPTPSPSPTAGPGQQLLAKVGQNLSTAKTLHGIFDLTISGQTFSGVVNLEIWNALPGKSRTHVLQSSLAELPTGSVTVTDGKQVWQYDPVKNVVYNGPVSSSSTSNSGSIFGGGGQSQVFFNLVQTVFTHSNATLVSSSATINGHTATEIHVTPSGSPTTSGTGSGIGNFSYDGEVYVDTTTNLPLRVNLNISGLGQIVLNFPTLTLNQTIPASTFTFIVPPGVKVLPLPQASATPGAGSLTLAEAQQQAGYHLLSIPASQTDYELEGVNALGTTGSELFTLNYIKGNLSFTIAEGKPLANLPNSGGQPVTVRGVSGSLSTANGITTLAWTENGVGIRIAGAMSADQAEAIAKLLS
jgi:outer membrane lipoprotein-sorting protein